MQFCSNREMKSEEGWKLENIMYFRKCFNAYEAVTSCSTSGFLLTKNLFYTHLSSWLFLSLLLYSLLGARGKTMFPDCPALPQSSMTSRKTKHEEQVCGTIKNTNHGSLPSAIFPHESSDTAYLPVLNQQWKDLHSTLRFC